MAHVTGHSAGSNILADIKVFLVDDEDILAWSLETELRALGAEVMRAASVRQSLERFPAFGADVAITDIRLPDGNGLELLKKWRMDHPELPIILITAHGAIDSAITALRLGAFDYLQKPFDTKDLIAAVKRAAEVGKLRQKVSRLEGEERSRDPVRIVGEAAETNLMREQLKRIAQSRANTSLILGESGTGKELAARAIHEWGERAGQPFVEINCASIPENLLESELFGYERGAFTDAKERKLGLFEMAKHGSILLDEIGEMPMKLQSKLLRALESRRFKRLGGTKDIEFGARIIAATNRDLLREVAAGRFRGDLYYRIGALPVRLPPLRQRLDDIPQLVRFFLEDLAKELGFSPPKVAESALKILRQHPWPGNVRELRNVLQRALVFHQPTVLSAEHVELEHFEPTSFVESVLSPSGVVNPVPYLTGENQSHRLSGGFVLPQSGLNLEDLERSLLTQALQRSHNNQTKAAALLGISRHTLRYRLEKHGLVEEAPSGDHVIS
jgi:two-component system response regulator AtoC